MNDLANIFSNLKLEHTDLEIDTVDSISETMQQLSLITQQEYSINTSTYEKFKVDKYIPLEVSNVFCNKFFDDEDFVYIKLQLPERILEFIAHESNGDILDYFSTILQHKTDEPFQNDDIYYNIISVYQYVLSYYQHNNYSPVDRIKSFPLGYFKWVSYIIQVLKNKINFTPDSLNGFYEMSKIDQELSYGMNLIITQLQIIIHYYQHCGMNIYQLSNEHIHRFIRLTNNLCVIMIYLKFCATHFNNNKALTNNPDFIQEDNEYENYEIEEENNFADGSQCYNSPMNNNMEY